MSYYNGQAPGYPGLPQAPFGIAPPLGLAPPGSGYLQAAPGAYAYGHPGAAQGFPPGYGQFAAQGYGGQQQGMGMPAAGYYAQQGYAQQQAPGVYGAAAQGYGGGAVYAGGYTGPQYSHHVAPGVQTDAYGLPFVQGDITLQYAQAFKIEEKAASATRDSFVVRDMNGALRYKVDGSFSINEVKTMRDIHGQILLILREARLRMRDRVTIFSPTNVPLMTLQKTSPVQIGTKRVHGFVGAYPKGSPDVVITGNHNNTHFRIMNAQTQEVGVVRRKKYTFKNMLTDQDTYEVNVQGGSPALICLMAVGLDEIYED